MQDGDHARARWRPCACTMETMGREAHAGREENDGNVGVALRVEEELVRWVEDFDYVADTFAIVHDV